MTPARSLAEIKADQEPVAVAKQAVEDVLDHILHADDPARDLRAHLGHRLGQPSRGTPCHDRSIPDPV